MQTFLPYKSFEKSAKVLDYKRLGKQRVEAWQILNTLEKKKNGVEYIITKAGRHKKLGWLNHPAVLMWEGYETCLKLYYDTMVKEWIAQGYNNTMQLFRVEGNISFPSWLGDEDFHASHRSNLLRKDKQYYSKFKWTEPDNLEYVWPVTRD